MTSQMKQEFDTKSLSFSKLFNEK